MTRLSRTRAAAIAVICSTLGCAHGTFAPLDPKALPGPDAFPGASVAILLSETTVEFHPGDGGRAVADVTTHEQWRVLQPGGAAPTSVTAHYIRDFSEVRSIEARIIRPDGEIEVIDPKKQLDTPTFSNLLYEDGRAVSLPVPALPAGAVLEYRYVVREKEPKVFGFDHAFGARVPVATERVTAIAPDGWKIQWQTRRLGEPIELEPSVQRENGQTRTEWVLRDLPATNDPSTPLPFPPVLIARLERWTENGTEQHGFANPRELSAWYFELNQGADTPSDQMRTVAEKLIAEAGPDLEARARRLHRFVCEEIEYCAVELGYGAWKPHDASKVFDLRYGDCKDKANLLHTLLGIAGVKSRLTLVSAHDGLPWSFGLPTVTGNFNHMVLMVDLPGRSFLVDPTQRTVPFGEIPASIAEAPILPIQQGGAELQTAPALAADENGERFEISLVPDAAGTLRGDFTLVQRGAPASELRARMLGRAAAKRDEGMRDWLGLNDALVEGTSFQGLERGEKSLGAKGKLRLSGALRGAGDARVVTAADLLTARVPLLTHASRRTPWVAGYRRADDATVSLRLPAGAQVRALPPPVRIESPMGRYELHWTQADGALVLQRSVTFTEHIVQPAQYAVFRDFVQAIHDAEAKPVLFTTPTAATAADAP